MDCELSICRPDVGRSSYGTRRCDRAICGVSPSTGQTYAKHEGGHFHDLKFDSIPSKRLERSNIGFAVLRMYVGGTVSHLKHARMFQEGMWCTFDGAAVSAVLHDHGGESSVHGAFHAEAVGRLWL